LGVPDGRTPRRGITVVLGPNNSGKSSLLEALAVLHDTDRQVPLRVRFKK
jgi:AAA15 family ATPase/GTPase